jgi:TIGR03009 family protein
MRRIAGLVVWTFVGGVLTAAATAQTPGATGRPGPPAQGPASGRPSVAPPNARPGQPPPPRPAAPKSASVGPTPLTPEQQKQIDEILAKWEQASSQIKTMYAEFEQLDKLALVQVSKKYQGQAYLQRPNLAVLDLKREDKEKNTYVPERRIVSTGKEVLEFDAAQRQVTVFPLPEDLQQRALEEGPLPFLFNMKVAEFKKRYHAYLHTSDEKSYTIVIQPLQAIDRDAFLTAKLVLNREKLLPDAIYTLSANREDQQHYLIKKLIINGTFSESMFAWNPAESQKMAQKGWRIVVNPGPTAEAPGEGLEPIGADQGAARAGQIRPRQ